LSTKAASTSHVAPSWAKDRAMSETTSTNDLIHMVRACLWDVVSNRTLRKIDSPKRLKFKWPRNEI
jgi:hypothetical protein